MASLPPVSPGSLLEMTESPGGAADFVIEDALGEQMDQYEQQQAWDAWNASPAGPEEGQGGEDDYEDDGYVWAPPPVNTFDPSP